MDTALLSLGLETLQARQTEAMDALHRLNIGDRVVSVATNSGNKAEYSQVNIDALRAYITDLQNAISAKKRGDTATRRPVYITF